MKKANRFFLCCLAASVFLSIFTHLPAPNIYAADIQEGWNTGEAFKSPGANGVLVTCKENDIETLDTIGGSGWGASSSYTYQNGTIHLEYAKMTAAGEITTTTQKRNFTRLAYRTDYSALFGIFNIMQFTYLGGTDGTYSCAGVMNDIMDGVDGVSDVFKHASGFISSNQWPLPADNSYGTYEGSKWQVVDGLYDGGWLSNRLDDIKTWWKGLSGVRGYCNFYEDAGGCVIGNLDYVEADRNGGAVANAVWIESVTPAQCTLPALSDGSICNISIKWGNNVQAELKVAGVGKHFSQVNTDDRTFIQFQAVENNTTGNDWKDTISIFPAQYSSKSEAKDYDRLFEVQLVQGHGAAKDAEFSLSPSSCADMIQVANTDCKFSITLKNSTPTEAIAASILSNMIVENKDGGLLSFIGLTSGYKVPQSDRDRWATVEYVGIDGKDIKYQIRMTTNAEEQNANRYGRVTIKYNGQASILTYNQNSGDAEGSNEAIQNDLDAVAEANGGTSDPCYTNAGALGWLICPIVTATQSVLAKVYGEVKKNFLNVRADMFSNSNTGILDAWSALRNIANIVFIILILIVVFSQVTGIGIDNYGIKKILPRLIITAILVNLSYIICQLAVDISNIVGWNLESFLSGLGPNTLDAGGYEPNGIQGVLQNTVVFGTVIGVAVGAILLNPGIIITFLLFLLSAAIAVLFMWIILIVRQVGVVLAVVLSPLAFVCYLLPNTNKLFQKWLNIMKALLLVFPLCALVVGGGQLGGKILAQVGQDTGNHAFSLAAMILQVVPFFLIPSLLKGSLAGLGAVGAKINGASAKARSGANRKIKESNAYKSGDARLKGSNLLWRQNYANSKFGKSRFGRMLGGGAITKNAARGVAATNKMEQEDRAARTLLDNARNPDELLGKFDVAAGSPTIGTAAPDSMMGRLSAAIDKGDAEAVKSITERAIQKYGAGAAGQIGSMIDYKSNTMSNDENFQKSVKGLGQLMRENSTFGGLMTAKAGDTAEYLTNGGRDRMGAATTVSTYTKDSSLVTAAKDYATQSGATLERFVSAGVASGGAHGISTDMANQLLTSDDPAIRSGMQSEQSKITTLLRMPGATAPINRAAQASQTLQVHQTTADAAQEQAAQWIGTTTWTHPTATTTHANVFAPPSGTTATGAVTTVGANQVVTVQTSDGRAKTWNLTEGHYQ
jgi:hypothetical protein